MKLFCPSILPGAAFDFARGFPRQWGRTPLGAVSTFIVRGAYGGNTLGVARLANVYGGWAVATLWNPPDQRNVLGILGYGSLGMSIKAGSNVFRQFWPDVKKRLKH